MPRSRPSKRPRFAAPANASRPLTTSTPAPPNPPPPAKAPLSRDDSAPWSSVVGKLDDSLVRAIDVMGFTQMTPVQQQILTGLPDWRSDCLVQAKTGTGKTLAFLLPVLHSIVQRKVTLKRGQVAALIITPIRELAQQIAKECDQLTSQIRPRLQCHIAVGGTARASTLKRFLEGDPKILVATPGRLSDYLSEAAPAARLTDVQTVILDEADTMLEAGFLAAVKSILALIPPKSTGWQGMCFSATVPPKVKNVVDVVLKSGYTSISTIDENESLTHERVPQYSLTIPSPNDTFTALAALLKSESAQSSKIIVFGYTANLVALFSALYSHLPALNLPIFEIHSRLNQGARTRATADFKAAKQGIMFASDVVGRGMDFPNVDLVVQVGPPVGAEQYVHRVGRTARAGKEGRAVILLTQAESYFLSHARHLPIVPHPEGNEILAAAPGFAGPVRKALDSVDAKTKRKAYTSMLGFFANTRLLKELGLDKAGLVRTTNDFALRAMACGEVPAVDKKVVGKMGLKGVPGLNLAAKIED